MFEIVINVFPVFGPSFTNVSRLLTYGTYLHDGSSELDTKTNVNLFDTLLHPGI